MNILNKIRKKWDFSKSVKQNAIYFNVQEKKTQRKTLLFALIIIALAIFFNNPLLGLLIIGSITYGTTAEFNAANTQRQVVAELDSTHFVIAYRDADAYVHCKIGTISGTTISYGSEYTINTSDNQYLSIVALDSTHFVVAYRDAGNSQYGTAIVGTVANGNEISYGTEVVFSSVNTTHIAISKIDSTHFAVAYFSYTNEYGLATIGTVASGNVITYGSEYTFNAAATSIISITTLDSTHIAIGYNDSATVVRAIIGVISSVDTITFGSEYWVVTANSNSVYVAALDATHFVMGYRDNSNSSYGTVKIGVVSSGDTITFGSAYVFESDLTDSIGIDRIDDTNFILGYRDYNNSTSGTAVVGTVANGDEVSYGDLAVYTTGASEPEISIIDSTHFVVVYADSGDSYNGWGRIGVIETVTTYTKTIQAKARIQHSDIAKTVQAKARIKDTDISKTIQAKARVKITLAKTIQAKANIKQHDIDKTIQSKTRIKNTDISKTIQTKARVKQSWEKTIQSKAMITKEGLKNIQAKATVQQFGTSKTIQSKVDIKHPDIAKTIQAKARLKQTPVKTIQSKARLEQTGVDKTIQSKARIKTAQIKTIKAKATIKLASIVKTIQAKSNIKQAGIVKTITAKANLWAFRAGYVKMRSRDQEYPITLNSDKDYNKLRSVDQEYPITLKDNRIL